MRLIGIDFETANNHPLSACSIGMVVFEDFECVYETEWLLKPPRGYGLFEKRNIEIHGITEENVEEAHDFSAFMGEHLPWFTENAILVAHHLPFDLNVFRALCEYFFINVSFKATDSVLISRKRLPDLINHRLNTVSEYLNIELDHHHALSDAQASALIALNLMLEDGYDSIDSYLRKLRIPLVDVNIM